MSRARTGRPEPLTSRADAGGHFGEYGGRYVPETLTAALEELTEAYARIGGSKAFQDELDGLLATYAGRPTPLTFAARMTEQLGAKAVVLAQARPGRGQLVERRDQRLGHVAPAVLAEVDAGAHACEASTHARSASWCLTPGADSVERAESTAHGLTAAIASATFSGPSPPASMTRPGAA